MIGGPESLSKAADELLSAPHEKPPAGIPTRASKSNFSSRRGAMHYVWAGLDFMFDAEGTPVLLEANKSSHMLGEYLEFFGDNRPFELTAQAMNSAGGEPCCLWRRGDPFPDADEDACFMTRHLAPFLNRPPVICNVEDNQDPRTDLVSREGDRVIPGSIFRWWYGLPWSYERAGVQVINPNSVWVAVRDKLTCYGAIRSAQHFRVPQAVAVSTVSDVRQRLRETSNGFRNGFVIKPRVGWGGHGVQVFDAGEMPRDIGAGSLLSERIRPPLLNGLYWDVRAFVMNGIYLGAIRHTSTSPVTNYHQGGRAERLEDHWQARLEPAALEAVALLDAVADGIHQQPVPETELTHVDY